MATRSCRAAGRCGSAPCPPSCTRSTSATGWCGRRCRGWPPMAGWNAAGSAATASTAWPSAGGRRSGPPPSTSTTPIRRRPAAASSWCCWAMAATVRPRGRPCRTPASAAATPGVWVAPAGTALPPAAADALRLDASADAETRRRLAALSWPLDQTASAYRHFLAEFEPLQAALAAGGALPDQDSFIARILLIHAWRRIVLRDPVLPADLLPPDWPGTAARALSRRSLPPAAAGLGTLARRQRPGRIRPLPRPARSCRRGSDRNRPIRHREPKAKRSRAARAALDRRVASLLAMTVRVSMPPICYRKY